MSALRIVRCKSCDARIFWAVLESGKMPIDAEPDGERGNLAITGFVRDGERQNVPRVEYADEDARERYLSHFATCPQAERHRRARSSFGAGPV